MADKWWNPDRVLILVNQWLAGLSARTIALQLGCTRNTIMGKVHRLRKGGKLVDSQRKPPVAVRIPKGTKSHPLQTRLTGPVKGLTPRPVKPSVMVGKDGVSIMDLHNEHCRAIIGHGSDGLARYCGQPKQPWADRFHGTVIRSSYCGDHNREYHNSYRSN